MASSLQQWESDPLFSAAEVVQDSADRMQSVFRLLLHEEGFTHGSQSDPIDNHKRDLATVIETTMWQLEDFERAVYSRDLTGKYQMREDAISRHQQFIGAIREQVNQVQKWINESSIGNSRISTELINSNEQDRDGFALFLTGGSYGEHSHHSSDDSSILRRFLDPTTSSTKDAEKVLRERREIEELRDMDSLYPEKSDMGARDSLKEIASRKLEVTNWDLEANESIPGRSFHQSKSKGSYGKLNLLGFFNSIWPSYRSLSTLNYTKRLKDGDVERLFPSNVGSPASQGLRSALAPADRTLQVLWPTRFMAQCGWLRACSQRYNRFSGRAFNRHLLQKILTSVFTLILLGTLVSRIS